MKTNDLNGTCRKLKQFTEEETVIIYIYISTMLNVHLFIFFIQQMLVENLHIRAINTPRAGNATVNIIHITHHQRD